MKIRKHSRQRDAILKNLSSRLDHPTADMIYRDLREEYPRISLGTVYRNLNLLAELGQIRKIHCEGGTEHYDYDTSDHCHFVCKHCGGVVDLPLETDHQLNALAAETGIGSVECHALVFYGICRSCEEAAEATVSREQVAAPL